MKLAITKHTEWPHVRVAYVHDSSRGDDFFGEEFAVVYGGSRPVEQVEQIARLIAAAPDLLAACKAANKSLADMAARGGWLPGEAGIDEWSRVQQGLSAAITKAKAGAS